MPSVGGMRRSTRIFVPKSVAKDGNSGKVLRSGKRLSLDSDEEKPGSGGKTQHFRLTDDSEEITTNGLPCYNTNGWRNVIPVREIDVSDMDGNTDSNESVDNMSLSDELRYKKVYDRKRRRSPNSSKDPMHGTFYVRKKSRNSRRTSSTSTVDVSENNVPFGAPGQETLDVSVDFSPTSPLRFTCFFASVLKFLQSSQLTLQGLAAFMCCDPIVSVFSQHGVHFKPGFSPRTSLATDKNSYGFFRLYGEQTFVPLFWLNFSAAPMAFRNLHSVVFLRSLYIPQTILCVLTSLSDRILNVVEKGETLTFLPTEISLPQVNTMSDGDSTLEEPIKNSVEVSVLSGGRVYTRLGVSRKIKKKRSTMRPKKVRNSFSLESFGIQHLNTNNEIKTNDSCNKDHGFVGFDVFGSMSSGNTPLDSLRAIDQRPNHVQKELCFDQKEVKSTFVGWRPNMDSLHCNANILVIESDRGYREEGATVMMECSTSKGWHVAVKVRGLTRYLHQAQEVIRPNTTNRFTHAVIWTADNGWKLEFCDRKDWLLFKELHKECLSKNVEFNSSKTIPVPGVREVLNYDFGECVPFSRPDSYIVVHHNEVARALVKKTATYDIDQDDEEWLEKLDTGTCNGDAGVPQTLSRERFEEMIDILEKAAYRNPYDVSDAIKMTSLCSDLGTEDFITAVYQYWLRKRKQKHAPLLGVFECQPPTKGRVAQENVLRKKRSFKKHVSQSGRVKQQCNFEGMYAEDVEVAKKRVDDAQRKAEEAFRSAVEKRKRAQKLMENADLAAYLAAMAVKIAETVESAESPSEAADFLTAG